MDDGEPIADKIGRLTKELYEQFEESGLIGWRRSFASNWGGRMSRAGWTKTNVAAIAGSAPKAIAIGPFGSKLRAELYVDAGVPVLRGQDITDAQELDGSSMPFASVETAASLSGSIVVKDDLVFPHRGVIGQVGIVGDTEYPLSSSMMKLTCDTRKADPMFRFYYFRGPGRAELLSHASTVASPGIGQPLRSLRGIPLVLPPLHEQHAIAEVLGALNDKIPANATLANRHAVLADAVYGQVRNSGHLVSLELSAVVTTQYGITTSARADGGPRLLRATDINE